MSEPYTPSTDWIRIMVGGAKQTAPDRVLPPNAAREEGYEWFDRWIAAYDAEVRASEREDCDGCALLEKDVARFVAERDALAAQLDALRRARLVGDSFLSWHDFGHKVGRILDADPSTVLAERDAQKWDEGYRSGGSRAMRRMSDEPSVPDAVNPYRARAEREGNRD